MEEVLEREILCIKPNDLAFPPEHNKNSTRYKPEANYCVLLDENVNSVPCYKLGPNHIDIKWTYIIDLDREVFSVDSSAHFKLPRVPRNYWISSLKLDTRGRR